MNIVLRELRANLKSLLIWGGSMVFLIYVGMVKYIGVSQAGDSMNELIESMPVAIRNIWGLGAFDLSNMSGYYGVFFSYFALIGSIHAVMLGSIIITKEERDKTADFLLVKPIKRHQVVTSKIIAAFINIVIFNLLTLISSFVFVDIYNKGEPINREIILSMIGLFFIQVIFLCLGFGISSFKKRVRKAASLSTAVLLGTYMISVVVDTSEKMSFLRYFTPFKYFDAKEFLPDNEFNVLYIIIAFIISVISIALTYINYNKREIAT